MISSLAAYSKSVPYSCWVAIVILKDSTAHFKHKKAPFLKAGDSDRDTSDQHTEVFRPWAERLFGFNVLGCRSMGVAILLSSFSLCLQHAAQQRLGARLKFSE